MSKTHFTPASSRRLTISDLRQKPLPKNAVDLTGLRFGRLTVIQYLGSRGRASHWLCRCDCGNESMPNVRSLRAGVTMSCGCLRKERAAIATSKAKKTHGKTVGGNQPIYRVWSNMMSRCYNQNVGSYKHYGARGIKVCDEWQTFSGFLADMGDCPEGMTLDRTDNNSNYSKENCKWATQKEQCNNRRSNRHLEIDGVTMTVAQWGEQEGAQNAKLIYNRISFGWNAKDAVFKPKSFRVAQ